MSVCVVAAAMKNCLPHLLTICFASSMLAQEVNPKAETPFVIPPDANGGKTIIWPKHNSATRPTMLWDESPAGPRVKNDMREE